MAFSVENLDSLIEELTKNKPDQKKIKLMMEQVGLKYSSDSIEQMNMVLQFMSSSQIKAKAHRGKQKTVEL